MISSPMGNDDLQDSFGYMDFCSGSRKVSGCHIRAWTGYIKALNMAKLHWSPGRLQYRAEWGRGKQRKGKLGYVPVRYACNKVSTRGRYAQAVNPDATSRSVLTSCSIRRGTSGCESLIATAPGGCLQPRHSVRCRQPKRRCMHGHTTIRRFTRVKWLTRGDHWVPLRPESSGTRRNWGQARSTGRWLMVYGATPLAA